MQILDQISLIAKQIKVSTPYICGGIPRDRVISAAGDFHDIDITTGDETIHALAKAVHGVIPGNFKVLDDGHAQLVTEGGLSIDFSSNFVCPGAKELMQKAGITEPTKMQLELYSRDFTCNALLMTMDLKTVKDPIGLGAQDIKNKRLRTCLPASVTLGVDNKRIARAIYLASKLGFEVDTEIISWVSQNPATVANVSKGYVTRKLNQALDYNINKTVELINKMNIWPYIPVTERLVPYLGGSNVR